MVKQFIHTGIIVAVLGALAVAATGAQRPAHQVPPAPAATTSVAETHNAPAPLTATPAPRLPAQTLGASAAEAPAPADNVVLTAGTTTYRTYVSGNGSVIDLMRSLASTSGFFFTGREYPSLGFFVDSINGQKNGNGLYWILYVNGVSSDLGASGVQVHPGDTVAWRYEKSN